MLGRNLTGIHDEKESYQCHEDSSLETEEIVGCWEHNKH